jgi:sugar lactone lactonase YvrE
MTGYCGDMVIDGHGCIYIDDTGARVLHGEEPCPGRLLVVDPTPKDGKRNVSVAADGLVFPNGVAISNNGDSLYISETFAYRLQKFSLDSSGKLSQRTTVWDTHSLSSLTTKEFEKFSGIDGICIDKEDGMWMAMLEYEVFVRRDVNGVITHKIEVQGHATACTLGGVDGETLWLVVNTVPEGEDLFEAMRGRRTRCQIFTVEVDVGRGKARP